MAAGGVAVLLQDRATELRTAGRKMVVARGAAGCEKKMALLFVVRRRWRRFAVVRRGGVMVQIPAS